MKFQCIYCSTPYITDKLNLGTVISCNNCGKKNIIPQTIYGQGRIIADDYIIEKLLGAGEMGSVFLAHQISLDRKVALKILSKKYSINEKYCIEFKKEARSIANLNHKNLTQNYAFGENKEDALYLSLEYVSGQTLNEILQNNNSLTIDNALNIIMEIAFGLKYAWEEIKIVHRDIKPENILISNAGKIKLTDMGLARNTKEIMDIKEISGTPSYMSPEQFLKKNLDNRSDIYSLGILLYHMVIGYLPFKSKSVKELAKMHCQNAIKFPKNSNIPTLVQNLIFKMTEKKISNRFKTYKELIQTTKSIRQKFLQKNHNFSIKTEYDFSKDNNYNSNFILPRKKTISLSEKNKQTLMKNTNRNKIFTILISFFIIIITIKMIYPIFPLNKNNLINTTKKLIKNIEKKQLYLNNPKKVIEQINIIENTFNQDTSNIKEWQTYTNILHLKNNCLQQIIKNLNKKINNSNLLNEKINLDDTIRKRLNIKQKNLNKKTK